jgi:hypothetical protein
MMRNIGIYYRYFYKLLDSLQYCLMKKALSMFMQAQKRRPAQESCFDLRRMRPHSALHPVHSERQRVPFEDGTGNTILKWNNQRCACQGASHQSYPAAGRTVLLLPGTRLLPLRRLPDDSKSPRDLFVPIAKCSPASKCSPAAFHFAVSSAAFPSE